MNPLSTLDLTEWDAALPTEAAAAATSALESGNVLFMNDTIRRFLFEHAPVRGEIVHLDATWRAVLSRHDYPLPVRALLGEMMAAAALLTATLKFGGTLIMQIQGSGPVQLLVVECTSGHHMRATAKWSRLPANGDLRTLVGDGKFAITLDPGQGRPGYQGVVALEGASVAAALESYMLLALYEHKVFVQNTVWGVNAFDQPGVELGKRLATRILPHVDAKPPPGAYDASTTGLIAFYQANRRG